MNLIDKDKLLEALAKAQKQPCVSLRKLVEEQPVVVKGTIQKLTKVIPAHPLSDSRMSEEECIDYLNECVARGLYRKLVEYIRFYYANFGEITIVVPDKEET